MDIGSMSKLTFSPDGKFLVSTFSDLSLFDTTNRQIVKYYAEDNKQITEVIFSPNGKCLLTGGLDSVARLWDIQTGKELRCFVP